MSTRVYRAILLMLSLILLAPGLRAGEKPAEDSRKLTVMLDWFVNPDHASNPTARRTASSRKDTSWPSQASAAGPHIHNRVRAGQSAGTCTDGSS